MWILFEMAYGIKEITKYKTQRIIWKKKIMTNLIVSVSTATH